MKIIFKINIFLFVILLIFTSASAYSPSVENGVSWLNANQNPNGSWGSNVDFAVLDTSVVLDTFKSLNVSNSAYSNGITWLSSQNPLLNDFLSRKIISLKMAGVDVSVNLSALVNSKNSDGGWGGDADSISMISDTALALQTLKSANYSDQTVIQSAISYFLSTQNPDGGWGFYQGDDSSVYMTAVVVDTLSQFKAIYDLKTSIANGVTYILTKQNADGGFGSSPSTVYETALAFNAMIASGAVGSDKAAIIQNALNYLTSTQSANGSWNDDSYSTALALKALANMKANLSILSSDITSSNPAPTVGDTVTLTANIKNTGLLQADNVVVQFYDGDPNTGGILIGETIIPSIPANGAVQTNIDWAIIVASSHVIFVKIDPSNSIDELSKSDNMAYANLTSATLPDLSISAADISTEPLAPIAGEPIIIRATVRNKGESAAYNVAVDFYDGNPVAGGTNLYTATLPLINAGSALTLQLTVNSGMVSHDLYVVIDKDNLISESDENNNIAAKNLLIEEGKDLYITNNDIYFNPANPIEGNPVVISATIHNQSEVEVNNLLVRFYLGDPDSGGTQIGSDVMIPMISARGIASASTTWDSTGYQGNTEIYVQVDPLDSIFEINEFNNKASSIVKVAAKTGADLVVTLADINFTPQSPIAGDIVTITANIKNIGTADASNVLIEFSLGDPNPNKGGSLIIGSQTMPFVAKGSSSVAQISWNTTGFAGSYEIYVNIDPFNEMPELIETNNTAHLPITITTPQGADLAITALDTSYLITDTQSLAVSGLIKVTLENKGNQDTSAAFDIAVFEDSNKNKIFDAGTDNVLGELVYSNSLLAGTIDTVNVSVSGNVLFKDNLIYAYVDSENSIEELDETNNFKNTGQQCEYIPPVGSFNPVLKWSWTKSNVLPNMLNVMTTPSIVDLNKDGVPDVVFGSTDYMGGAWVFPGVLRALDGSTGIELFTITNSNYYVNPSCSIAVGDIDLDGLPEIVTCDNSASHLIAFENNGTFKWRSVNLETTYGGSSPSLADLNNDGVPEIIIGRQVIDNNGNLLWTGKGGKGTQGPNPISIIADINMDGIPEIIGGNTAYKNDGSMLWKNASVPDGFNAIADFDDDPFPEIVLVSGGKVWLLEHDGTIKWGPISIPGGGAGGPPTVADFDGDGKPEIGVAASVRYVVFGADGTIKWATVIRDTSSNATGSSVFDFNGDGSNEVVYRDELKLRVYRGSDGYMLFETPMSSCTWNEYVLVADVDADNNAEIVAVANNNCGFGTQRGVYVFGDANDNWVNTRKIWNQHTYHITNINDDGTIPRIEPNNWEVYNNYRCNSLLPEQARGTADITASYITIDQSNYPASVSISARIGNGGAVSQIAGVDIAFYDGDPSQGGVLIATSKTTKVLEAGGYEDVSLTWNSPVSENHIIFVVADKDNKFNECREENNTASTTFEIGETSAVKLPDLEITFSDITIAPHNTIEGQPATIKAIIHNIGNLGASNVVISFYDGDPANGGILIGSVTKSYVDSGATALAEIIWNTFGQTGRNYIHVVVDPQNLIEETNENNNSTLVALDITQPTKPDLAITSTDVTFSNLNPKEGEALTVNVAVHNLGLDVGNIELSLYDGNPDQGGKLLKQTFIPQIISFGGKVNVSFELNTIGFAGNHNLYVSIDPDNKISEITETNNIAWNSLTIGSSGLNLIVSTDKLAYTANENIQITTGINNLLDYDRTGTFEVKILDLSDNVVSIVSSQALSLSSNENKTLNYVWNTGQTFSGNYKVYCNFIENNNVIAKANTPITILLDKTVSSKIHVDKISYTANEPVAITSTITSLSPNYIFQNLTARVSVLNNAGQVLFTEDKPIQTLVPGQLIELKTYWNTSTNPSGTYTVALEVIEGATTLSTSQSTFEIIGSSDTGSGLVGTITAAPNTIYQGNTETLTYNITNKGNEAISALNTKIIIVDPDTKEVKIEFTSQGSINISETIAGIQTASTAILPPKIYLAILQASTTTIPSPITLASVTFEVKPALEATKKIPDITNLLVWINDGCHHHHKEHDKCEHEEHDNCKDKNCDDKHDYCDHSKCDDKHDDCEHKDKDEHNDKCSKCDHINSQHTQCTDHHKKCIRQDLIENILAEAVTSYLIVKDKKDFERELRNPYYTDIMILGEQNPIEDHYINELKEQIYTGKGIMTSLYIKHGWYHDNECNHDQKHDNLFGIKYKGQLSGDNHQIELLNSPISEPDVLDAKGKANKIEANDINTIAAWIEEDNKHNHKKQYQYPAIVLNTYGLGKTIYYAFDLGLTLDETNYSQIKNLIKNSITYIHQTQTDTAFQTNQLVPVEIQIKSLGSAFNLKLTETYPQEITIYNPLTGNWITTNPWEIEAQLPANETRTILYYALMPNTIGTYTLKTDIGYIENNIYNLYQTLSLDINVSKNNQILTSDIITTLNALAVSHHDKHKLRDVIKHIEKVQKRKIKDKHDVEQNIHDILTAIDSLISINSADISSVRLMIDNLLIMWEGKWFLM